MDLRTAVESVALVLVAAWNVVAHLRVGRVKDQQIATLKSQIDQLTSQVEQVALLTFKGANDQIEALNQLQKREIEILKRQHAIEVQAAGSTALATIPRLDLDLPGTRSGSKPAGPTPEELSELMRNATKNQLPRELAETKRQLDAITGEREAFMERRVEDMQRLVDLLITPHHGSITSRYPELD